MEEYHKIQTVYKRDPKNNYKTLLEGDFSIPEFGFLANDEWVFTEKVDGTNIRIMFDGERIAFGGRTNRSQIPANLLARLNEMFLPQIEVFKNTFSKSGVCLYGEGHGAKIQKGDVNYSQNQDFVLFDIKINGFWLKRTDIDEIARNLKIDCVPIIGSGDLADMILKTRNGFNSMWGDFKAEGIVARPATELKTQSGHRIITKIKHIDFKAV